MEKLKCKRGYKRYMDFNHNRLVFLVKEWYGQKLMVDVFYNEQFIGYTTTEASWADFFNSDGSDALILKLMQESDALNEYESVFLQMNLSEENLLLVGEQFQLEFYVTVMFHHKTDVKVCRVFDSEKKQVIQQFRPNVCDYREIYGFCEKYLDGLKVVVDRLAQFKRLGQEQKFSGYAC